MSDKSFGDNTGKNVVKNPLLSTAVTGLSLEDLTHNAVLLPVAQSQELITRQDQQTGFQTISLPHSDADHTDPNPPPNTFTPLDAHHGKPDSIKDEDNFDVNEYFARLQCTRYVSAPINAPVKEDIKEENLEEINLNEPEQEVQQSITADIAQNFSQLPTVLPQVASAVFSSFSNMLNYKREVVEERSQEPVQEQRTAMQSTEVEVPLMGMDEPATTKEVAPPPKEFQFGSTNSYRITTRKKAYAQIPGLTSAMAPQYAGDLQNQPKPPIVGPPSYVQVEQKGSNIFNPMEQPKQVNPQIQPNVEPVLFTVPSSGSIERKLETEANIIQEPAVIPTNPVQGGAIIPPPPMFSNIPRKDAGSNSSAIGKPVLPPSVARRIGANQPIIKQNILPQPPTISTGNIFIPKPIENESQDPSKVNPPTLVPEASRRDSSSSQDLPSQNLPSAFVQFKSTYSNMPSMQHPCDYQMTMSKAHDESYSHTKGPIFPVQEITLPSPPTASVGMPSPNQMRTEPPSFFNPGNLSASLSAMNATLNKSVESAIASNTANISKYSNAPSTFFNPPHMTSGLNPTMITPVTLGSYSLPPDFLNTNAMEQNPLRNESLITDPQHKDITTDPILGTSQNITSQYFNQNAAASEVPKAIPEPPKLTGGHSYRMTKKRPQYYSGPIEGIGAISNNVKPVIPDAEASAFEGALITPDQQIEQQVSSDQTVPFDINKPAELTSSYTPFAINSQINNQAQSYTQPDYSTAFDLSRPTLGNYDPMNHEMPKAESKGFGIMGSLKSKLSALDINKIQNSLTTFFDPAYNEPKKEPTDGNPPYDFNQPNTGYGYSNQQSNLEIFVPNVENQPYNQSYNSQPQYQNIYSSPPAYAESNTFYYKGCGTGHGHYNHQHPPVQQIPPNLFSDLPPSNIENNVNISPPTQDLTNLIALPNTATDTLQMRQAFEEITNKKQNTDDNGNDEINLDKLEKEVTNLTRTLVVDNAYNSYNLFSNPSNNVTVMPVAINNSNPNVTDKLANPMKLDPSTALSFFDNPQIDNRDFQLSDTKQEHKNDNYKADTVDLTPDFSVDIIQQNQCEIKNSNDFFGSFGSTEYERKAEDFIQSPVGCAFVKKDSIEDIVRDVIKPLIMDESSDLMCKPKNIPPVNMSEVPLFGLSNILAEKTKEITDLEDSMQNITLQEKESNLKTRLDSDARAGILETLNTSVQPLTDEENDGISELNICETCREIDKPEDKNANDLTIKLIENITSPIQLSNPVVAPLTETNEERRDFDSKQCAEISHITEETFDTIQIQSATELLDDVAENSTTRSYGWTTEDNGSFVNTDVLTDHNYTFQIDSNAIGFFGNNPMFFDNIPNNASDEIKAELKSSQEDTPVVLSRQMSIPTAPPAEDDDSKSDETGGLDVQSIEQDAKKDFPIYEEFVIEPSETDDDKIEYKEREKSSDGPVLEEDSFTNRVERFKQMEETVDKHDDVFKAKPVFDAAKATSPAITIASYFDTGNYAVEAHYKNSLSSPTSIPYPISPDGPMRIPPGFENEYKRRLSGVTLQSIDKDTDVNVPSIPDTSTQTRPVITTTYSHVANVSSPVNVTATLEAKSEDKPLEAKLPAFSSVFGRSHESGDALTSSIFSKIEDKIEITPSIFNAPAEEVKPQKPLQDPISFFSAQQETNTEAPYRDSGFNRLASYFQTPAKNDHGKSFFELSQSQNHYRHALGGDANSNHIAQNSKTVKEFFDIPTDVYVTNLQMMKDLTSTQNISFAKDQNVRSVSYFTVEYDNEDIKTALKGDIKNHIKIDEPKNKNAQKIDYDDNNNDDDKIVISTVSKCMYCCNFDSRNVIILNKVELDSAKFKLKKTMDNDNTEGNSFNGGKVDSPKDDPRRDVTVSFEPLDEDHEGVALTTENRTTAEYTPVKHHWFYRVDFEGKSIWRGFSVSDSRALEEAFHSPDLTEDTLVPTDGGRFDVNVMGRLRIAVYWSDKPTSVRRCSWFYKGATDARYVPYTEPVAEKLEEEYHHGITTGEWHRRLVLPNNESVVMHGPSVMVHFPQSASDAFSSTPLFAFTKRVYRSPPKTRVPSDQRLLVDHLLLLVHGAGEYRHQRQKIQFQSTMRPRVVRRGCDETEIEDPEPSSIDHLLLLCHGVGSACDMRFRAVEEVVDDFRSTSLQLLQSHYRNSYDKGVVNRVEVLPISWHATLHSGETGVDKRLAAISLDSIPKLRNFTNDTVLDVLFYTSPVFCQTIIDTVCAELNRIYQLFMKRNPSFKGKVSLGGHSLGSVILYDLLCHQSAEASLATAGRSYVTGYAGTGQAAVKYPSLDFQPAAMYALGSPIAMFECIRGVKSLGTDFSLPTCKNFFNIFHPYDPIAYRIEPLINAQLGGVKPFLIPHHKGRKRMHLELRDTMARVGADLKAKLLESLRATWSSVWKQQPPNDDQLEKVVEEEIEKEQLCNGNKEEVVQNDLEYGEALGRLNGGRRVDYVLQEAPFEMINEYLFAMSSHVCYWESEDTMLLILREIYDALGVCPDCTVPQQTMTVQRTKIVKPDDNETIVMNATEHPSTSRGGT